MSRYSVIYNQDDSILFVDTKEPIEPHHVEKMVDEVADGGADVLLICPNGQRVNYPSKVWSTYWDGYTPADRSFFGSLPDDEVKRQEFCVTQMKRLASQGCDYMACSLNHCRKRGLIPGVSIRMNDMHHSQWPDSPEHSVFYHDHPGLHISCADCGPISVVPKSHDHAELHVTRLRWLYGPGANGLNYEHQEVRNYFLALIKELLERYDFEVLELDFLRFNCYFPLGSTDAHCAIMTSFVGEVHRL